MALLVLNKKLSCESLGCFETLGQFLPQTGTSLCKMKLKPKPSFTLWSAAQGCNRVYWRQKTRGSRQPGKRGEAERSRKGGRQKAQSTSWPHAFHMQTQKGQSPACHHSFSCPSLSKHRALFPWAGLIFAPYPGNWGEKLFL